MKTEQIGFQEHVEAAAGKVHVKVACAQFFLLQQSLAECPFPCSVSVQSTNGMKANNFKLCLTSA